MCRTSIGAEFWVSTSFCILLLNSPSVYLGWNTYAGLFHSLVDISLKLFKARSWPFTKRTRTTCADQPSITSFTWLFHIPWWYWRSWDENIFKMVRYTLAHRLFFYMQFIICFRNLYCMIGLILNFSRHPSASSRDFLAAGLWERCTSTDLESRVCLMWYFQQLLTVRCVELIYA